MHACTGAPIKTISRKKKFCISANVARISAKVSEFVVYVSNHTTYPANFIETSDIVNSTLNVTVQFSSKHAVVV